MDRENLTRRKFTRDATLAALGVGVGLNAQAAEKKAGLKFTIIGDSSCVPDVGHDSACFLINGKHLVDTGWCSALNMRQHGVDPLSLESIILTHFHQDHYLGLPQLLFFMGIRKRRGPRLKIIGPDQHLEDMVQAAVAFLQTSRFPELTVDHELVPIKAGDRFELPDLRFETMAAKHFSGKNQPEQALVYRVTEKNTGARAVFTGDTSYHPPIAEFAKGVPLLIHDGAHTSAKDAATIARTAGAGRLLLIHHLQKNADRILKTAKTIFPNTELAKEGSTVEVSAAG